MYILISWLAILSYLTTEVFYGLFLFDRRGSFAKAASRLLVFSMAIHFAAMLERSYHYRLVPYKDLYGSLSLFAWMVALIYLALEFRHRQKSVGAFLLPIPIILMALATVLDRNPQTFIPPAELRGALFAYHVTTNIFAYSAFTVSFILSAIYLLQHHQIRVRRPGLLFSRLPSLDLLERMNRTSVGIGVPVLCCGILLGAIWAHKIGAHWRWDPKLVWSLVTLLVYAGFLYLASRGTWKGKRSAILSVCGFLLILFSYSVVNLFFSSFHKFY